MDHSLPSAQIGIFVSRRGATGWADTEKGVRKLSDARLRQVLYFCRAQKPIVVLDPDDLRRIAGGANIGTLLKRKIEALEEMRATPAGPTLEQVDAPAHLASVIKELWDDDNAAEGSGKAESEPVDKTAEDG
jgi:hypothetical protein